MSYRQVMGRPKQFDEDTAIAQAVQVFWTNGYAGSSPADLAGAAGIGKGSLYHAFGSKRELFGRALDAYQRAAAELSEEFLAGPGTAKERIRAYLVMLVDADFAAPVRRGCFAVNTALELGGRDAEATASVRRQTELSAGLLAARIERGKLEGDVPASVDAAAQARFLMTALAGLRVMARAYDREAVLEVVDTTVDAVFGA
ncbi:transcriptional regulator, TetR family [Kitasatospora cheerisanensis KCTC 2395]|uniref:Transcriptional regulator, TetR family n=2 Tax=Kitasatospora cheerisanensis TaxID=81942 RepID=A0A066YT07_9ACTN|nr:transcriptional regulator, TetR family [Kitasatospora cheerisanensis KCTC 2395]